MKTGICSITFRALSVKEVAQLVQQARLDAIEWGGDVHVPHGSLNAAEEARKITADCGLEVSSYGSYFSPLDSEGQHEDFQPILDVAQALGAPAIRMWAGRHGSDALDVEYRNELIETTWQVAETAAKQNIKVAFEFHADTLTDTNESAVKLYQEVNHFNLYAYWQPPYWRNNLEYRIDGLRQLQDRLLNVHVFQWDFSANENASWSDRIDRRPLQEGAEEWKHYFNAVHSRDRYALLEFVRHDRSDHFLQDAEVLKSWLG